MEACLCGGDGPQGTGSPSPIARRLRGVTKGGADGGPVEAVKATPDTEQIIRRTIEHLQRRVRVHQVVFFGSHARGEANAWSDVDLAVISPDFARMSHRKLMDLLVEVALAVDPSVEIRPYTPREL